MAAVDFGPGHTGPRARQLRRHRRRGRRRSPTATMVWRSAAWATRSVRPRRRKPDLGEPDRGSTSATDGDERRRSRATTSASTRRGRCRPNVTGVYLDATATTVGAPLRTRDVISGNSYVGVWMSGPTATPATGPGRLHRRLGERNVPSRTTAASSRTRALRTTRWRRRGGGREHDRPRSSIMASRVLDTSTGDSMLANAVYSNSGLGIDLDDDGVTAASLDSDSGAQRSAQPGPRSPPWSRWRPTCSTLFSLDAAAARTGSEFFGARPGPMERLRQGGVFAGSRNITHPGGGALPFGYSFPGSAGDVITATTTAGRRRRRSPPSGAPAEFAEAPWLGRTAVS